MNSRPKVAKARQTRRCTCCIAPKSRNKRSLWVRNVILDVPARCQFFPPLAIAIATCRAVAQGQKRTRATAAIRYSITSLASVKLDHANEHAPIYSPDERFQQEVGKPQGCGCTSISCAFTRPCAPPLPWRRVFLIGFGRWKNWWSRLHEILANIAAFIRFSPGGGNS